MRHEHDKLHSHIRAAHIKCMLFLHVGLVRLETHAKHDRSGWGTVATKDLQSMCREE